MSFNHFLVEGYFGCVEMNFINRNYSFNLKNKIDLKFDSTNKKENYEEFVYPSWITNAIIKIGNNKNNLNNIGQILSYLQYLLCKYIVVDFECKTSLNDLDFLLKTINDYNIHEALLLLNYSNELYCDDFADLVLSSNRYNAIIIFSSPFDKNLEDMLYYYKQPKSIKKFSKNKTEFNSNLQLYTESLNYHTYFNRKLYIGENGEVKNAPECKDSFGFIQNYDTSDELKEIIHSSEFQKYWHINKEMCDICKDCEHRFMCVDNRLPYQRSNGEWYHNLECNYNPYICKWEGEKGYKTLNECGVISGENGFSINHKKIEAINEELWKD